MSDKIKTKFGNAHITGGYYRICSHKEGNFRKRLHRLIYEDYHKVTLLPNAFVHHIDGNKLNNSIDNLTLMSPSEHSSHHQKGKNNSMYGRRGKLAPNFQKEFSKEHRRNLSISHTGKKLSESHKKNISLCTKGEKNAMYGKTHTKEARRKISEKKNTSGVMYVSIRKDKHCKQGFTYVYSKMIKGKIYKATSITLDGLKKKVLDNGWEWTELQFYL